MTLLELILALTALVLGTLAVILAVPVLELLGVILGAVSCGMLLNRKND